MGPGWLLAWSLSVPVVRVAVGLVGCVRVDLRSSHGVWVVLRFHWTAVGVWVFIVKMTRVASRGKEVLPAVAWHHLQVGVTVPAVICFCAWDPWHTVGPKSWQAADWSGFYRTGHRCRQTVAKLRHFGGGRVWVGLFIFGCFCLFGFLLWTCRHNWY